MYDFSHESVLIFSKILISAIFSSGKYVFQHPHSAFAKTLSALIICGQPNKDK